MYCTNNTKNDDEMDGVEVIDLCSVSQMKNEVCGKGKESAKQENQDKMKSDELIDWKTKLGPKSVSPQPEKKRSKPQ